MDLRERRKSKGLTQEQLGRQLAHKLMTSERYGQKCISLWESTGKLPSLRVQNAIAEILGTPDLSSNAVPAHSKKKAWNVCLLEDVKSRSIFYTDLAKRNLTEDRNLSWEIRDYVEGLLSILVRSYLTREAELDAARQLEEILNEIIPSLSKGDSLASILRTSIKSIRGISENPADSFP